MFSQTEEQAVPVNQGTEAPETSAQDKKLADIIEADIDLLVGNFRRFAAVTA